MSEENHNTILEESLIGFGVNPALARSLLFEQGARAVERTLAWYARQGKRVGPGVLVAELRAGGDPGRAPDAATFQAKQKAYGEEIADWLKAKMPYVCQVDKRIIEFERELHGDAEAEKLAGSTKPHYAAVAAVIALHHRHGKGRLTVGEHGPVIRAAVKAANEEAVEDYKAIKAKRSAEPQAPPSPLTSQAVKRS